MKRRHPFHVLLILLLGLCIFGVDYSEVDDWQPTSPVGELDEGFEEGMENSPEEDLLAGTDIFGFEYCTWEIICLRDAIQPLSAPRMLSPSLCSLGWVLPLRI